jgi:FdhD protein
MADEFHVTAEVARYSSGVARIKRDEVAVEEPLEVRLNGKALSLTMRTPGDDEALAAGFLLTEGIIRSRDDIWDIKRCGDPRNRDVLNVVEVVIPESLTAENAEYAAGTRNQRYSNSACGICGRASIDEVVKLSPPFESAPMVSAMVVQSLPDKLRAAQSVFEKTGGLHAAGLFDKAGNLLNDAEDIGRHNAVDKVIGKSLLTNPINPPDPTDMILLVSGRAGFEIVQKAVVARIPVVCSVSAPSSLAVELAVESGMILIGFLRGASMNIYAGMDRVTP